MEKSKVNPWIFIVIGVLFCAFGTISLGYGWLRLSGEQPNQENKQKEDIFYIDIAPLKQSEKDAKYERQIRIRNNSKAPQQNVHFSVKCDRNIINRYPPWPEGGGMIVVNFQKIYENTYEAEVGVISPQRFIQITLASDEPFEVVNVKIY